jgi:hypothetical protein
MRSVKFEEHGHGAGANRSLHMTGLRKATRVYVDSEGYFWDTFEAENLRLSHKEMESMFVSWDSRPTLDGITDHCGEFANYRCVPEPSVSDKLWCPINLNSGLLS